MKYTGNKRHKMRLFPHFQNLRKEVIIIMGASTIIFLVIFWAAAFVVMGVVIAKSKKSNPTTIRFTANNQGNNNPGTNKLAASNPQTMIRQFHAIHTCGLPMAEGVNCILQVFADHIFVIQDNLYATIFASQIVNMSIKNDFDIQKHYVSSVGGAIGGGLLFGPVGAAIGGRAKQKTTHTTQTYLVITYKNSEGNLINLVFNVTFSYSKAYATVKEFMRGNKNMVQVNL